MAYPTPHELLSVAGQVVKKQAALVENEHRRISRIAGYA
jgi:hypothetical protein